MAQAAPAAITGTAGIWQGKMARPGEFEPPANGFGTPQVEWLETPAAEAAICPQLKIGAP